MKLIDLIGQTFGELTVLSRVETDHTTPNGTRRTVWRCHCSCGRDVDIQGVFLRSGRQASCGCKRVTHKASLTSEYHIWQGMKQRCTNPCSTMYHAYGARGIQVCERWLNDFEAFIEDVGERPSDDHSIDRIDVNGNYEPNNVRWATPIEQSQNKREQHSVGIYSNKYQTRAQDTAIYPSQGEFDGISYCLLGLSGEIGELSSIHCKKMRKSDYVYTKEDKQKMIAELGDVAWFVAQLANELGVSLASVFEYNITKLASRQSRGVISGSGDNR